MQCCYVVYTFDTTFWEELCGEEEESEVFLFVIFLHILAMF